ncbi:MAG: hypothetical protein ABS76_24675 [Pelagibacterium sp. SCN 64-44]|nr:MAG: hypothetical protein ABS76_24675 [Pelagibacterium sp. SCN 64-44]
MLTTVSPAALMLAALAAAPASAVDHVVGAGTTVAGVVLADGDSLTNNGNIVNPGNIAVDYPGPNTGGITFILNATTGRIEATGDAAININGALGKLDNAGAITSDGWATIYLDYGVGDFINSGSVTNTGTGRAVEINLADRAVGTFTNSGTITGGAGNQGVAFVNNNHRVGTFTNSGTITGGSWEAVGIEGGVDHFINTASGTIRNTGRGGAGDGHGVAFNTGTVNGGSVGSFENHGTIIADLTGGNGNGVGFFDGGDATAHQVGRFVNTGTIEGNANGVSAQGGFGTFDNSGTITSLMWQAVRSNGDVGSFTNSGTIAANGDPAVDISGTVGTFTNSGKLVSDAGWTTLFFEREVGRFTNSGHILNTNTGHGVQFDLDNGAVGSFSNSGTIAGGNGGVGVAMFGVNFGVGSFSNSGSILGDGDPAIVIGGTLDSFSNTGLVQSDAGNETIYFNSDVARFSNDGKIININANDGRGIEFNGAVGAFTNSGSVSSYRNGITFGQGFTTAHNSGSIVSRAAAGEIGVRINEPGGAFTNSGTIQGATAVGYILNTAGPNTLVNSGTLKGTDGTAIGFDNGDDLLKLETGSKIIGAVRFNGGDDTIDVADFTGNALLEVRDLEHVVAGTRMVYFDQPNDLLAIVETTGVTQGGQVALTGMATQLTTLITPVLNGVFSSGDGSVAPLGYMPAPQTAADLAIVQPQASRATAWATAIGGGSRDDLPVDIGAVYGALVAGTHAKLAGDTTLGVLGGVGSGRASINGGGQVVDTVAGIAGLYGRHEAGIVSIDFSLLGSVGGNQSAREIAGPLGPETARASYSSWFLAPSLGVSVPVLNTETGEVDLVGSVSYIGGQTAGYTETGSSVNLTVGPQTISLLDARLGLAGTFDVGQEGAQVTAKGGVFAQSNLGGTSVPVSFLGQTQNAAVAGSTDFGLYAGLGVSAPVGQLTLSANADAQWRFDGQISGSVRLGAKADF